MKKKILSVLLAGALLGSMSVAGMVAVSAEEDTGLAPGSYSNHPNYTPSDPSIVKTKHLMFAMPKAWQNETWKKDPNGGSAGLYWWTGYDNCKDRGWANDWPGYKADKVTEEGVDNMWAIDVPTYGNGEKGNGMQIIWNNNIDGGTETDPTKNPFREAAQQTNDTAGQYYSRNDKKVQYDPLFRYIYKNTLVKEGVAGADALDLTAENFWEEINKLAAKHLDQDYDAMSASDKSIVVDEIMDSADVDYSMFGSYAGNFFNEDNVGEPDLYPEEVSNGDCIAFTFDNMVYVIDFDVSKMSLSPLSQKLGMGGDFYFYYGGGEYGSWPTKELNTQMKEVFGDAVVEGNFTTGEYVTKTMEEVMKEYEELHKDDPTTTPGSSTSSTAGTASTDATSSSSSSTTGSATNTSNGAIATGQTSLVTIALIILVAGIGVVVFTRKKSQK